MTAKTKNGNNKISPLNKPLSTGFPGQLDERPGRQLLQKVFDSVSPVRIWRQRGRPHTLKCLLAPRYSSSRGEAEAFKQEYIV